MCYKINGLDLIISTKIFPNAQKDEIVGKRNGELLIKINAVAEGGKANKKVVAFLAKQFKIAKQSITIRSGELSRHKVLIVPYDPQIVEFLTTLKEA